MPTGEGVFYPAQRISTITVNGETSEEWTWTNDVLTSIMSTGVNGSLMGDSWFQYNNYRLVNMTTTLQGFPVGVNYTYSGDKLATIDASSGPMSVLNVIFTHNASGKVSHLTMNVNQYLLSLLSEFFGNGFPDIFGKQHTSPLASKWGVDNTAISADLSWQGDNVSQVVLSAQIDGTVSLSEIRQVFNIDSLFGPLVNTLAYIVDTSAMPIQVMVKDTTTYTYDNKNNPRYGFLGTIDPTIFSANNVTQSSSNRTVIGTLNLGLGQFNPSLPYPIESAANTYTYTYNPAGFPLTITDNEGNITQYIYQ